MSDEKARCVACRRHNEYQKIIWAACSRVDCPQTPVHQYCLPMECQTCPPGPEIDGVALCILQPYTERLKPGTRESDPFMANQYPLVNIWNDIEQDLPCGEELARKLYECNWMVKELARVIASYAHERMWLIPRLERWPRLKWLNPSQTSLGHLWSLAERSRGILNHRITIEYTSLDILSGPGNGWSDRCGFRVTNGVVYLSARTRNRTDYSMQRSLVIEAVYHAHCTCGLNGCIQVLTSVSRESWNHMTLLEGRLFVSIQVPASIPAQFRIQFF